MKTPKHDVADLTDDAWARCEKADEATRRRLLDALARAYAFAVVEGGLDAKVAREALCRVAIEFDVPVERVIATFIEARNTFAAEFELTRLRVDVFPAKVKALVEKRYGKGGGA